MSAPQKSSRWGSLLSQAVAGVEARLDTILAEDGGTSKESKPIVVSNPSPAPATPSTRSATPTRSTNDRLQERLARAIAAKNAASSTASSPRPSSDSSRLPSVANTQSTTTTTTTATSTVTQPATTQPGSPRNSLSLEDTTPVAPIANTTVDTSNATSIPTTNRKSTDVPSPRVSLQLESAQIENDTNTNDTTSKDTITKDTTTSQSLLDDEPQFSAEDATTSGIYKERAANLEQTVQDMQLQHQEELHSYIEQVDALQAKLQYLAREASQHARDAASSAPGGSLEKKIAEKDDQIAQLLEEGQKLASTEQKHRTIIKKMRAQLVTSEKELNEQKLWRQKAEREMTNLRRRVDQTTELEKANEETHNLLSQSKREMDWLKSENKAKDRSIADLKSQLQEESEKAKLLAAKADDRQREAGQKRIKELEDIVAALEVEKELAADRAKLQVAEAREKAERAAEHARALELELKGEVQVLENKLESLRASAEEASSGAGGDAQVKLLRQIETLQTQYSIASQNWQSMEASLEARAVNLEKERDEALRRESEMRRKARDAASRAKHQEEELEEMRSQLPTVQRDLQSYQSQLDTFKTRAEQAEAALADAKAELARHQASLDNDKGERTYQDRRNWLEDVPVAPFRDRGRPESPLLSAAQRTYSGDNFLGLQNYPSRLRKTSAPSSNGEPSPGDRPASMARRASAQPPVRSPLFPSLPRTTSSVASGFDFTASAPAPGPDRDRDDLMEGLERSASPQNVLQDMMSSSTMTAGPSVQLVERMSAAIRRLESERVAAKEELARISGQRDEARSEIVALMREVESGKTATKRVANLEKEVAEINERYQTTLEMLGEKSELVEELRADVQDVKAMYRDLVERTIK